MARLVVKKATKTCAMTDCQSSQSILTILGSFVNTLGKPCGHSKRDNMPPCLPNSYPHYAKSQHLHVASPTQIVFVEGTICVCWFYVSSHDMYVSEIAIFVCCTLEEV